MNKFLLLVLMCLPFAAFAQEGNTEKYLTGAIPVVDGKVTFTTEFQTPALSQEQLYDVMLSWANSYFKPTDKMNARVLYSNKEDGSIAAGGEEYLVFSSSALSLDRTRIYYQFLINCHQGKCNIEMTRIRYWYDEARNGGEKYNAEEWITDDMALNKSKTKLAPICGKFRRETIDLKDQLFKSVQSAIGDKLIAMGVQAPKPEVTVATLVPTTPVVAATPTTTVPAQTAPAQAAASNQSIDEQIKASARMTITAGSDEQFEIGKECWGGFGQLFGKEVAFCIIDQSKSMGNMLMDQSESYKISFFKQGSSEPWLVVKCKKLMKQNVSGEEAKKMNAANNGQKAYNMYVGEVIK